MGVSIEEVDGLEALRNDWGALLASSSCADSIFSLWDWQLLWWQFFGDGTKLRLLSVRDRSSLIGIWPLMEKDNLLSLVGGVAVCDYLDVIAKAGREDEVLGRGLQYLLNGRDEGIDLRFLPSASPTVQLLPTLAPRYGWNAEISIDEVCPAVDLPGDWESYLASLSKKDRHELRRKLRNVVQAGTVNYEVLSGPDISERAVTDFLHLHRLSRPEKSAFMDDPMEAFFRSVVNRFAPDGRIAVYFLALNDVRVAATLCLSYRDELWVYNSGFDREYAAHSVGLALKAFCIQDAIAKGKRKVDFLRGREPYKYDLGARDVPVYRLKLTRA